MESRFNSRPQSPPTPWRLLIALGVLLAGVLTVILVVRSRQARDDLRPTSLRSEPPVPTKTKSEDPRAPVVAVEEFCRLYNSDLPKVKRDYEKKWIILRGTISEHIDPGPGSISLSVRLNGTDGKPLPYQCFLLIDKDDLERFGDSLKIGNVAEAVTMFGGAVVVHGDPVMNFYFAAPPRKN